VGTGTDKPVFEGNFNRIIYVASPYSSESRYEMERRYQEVRRFMAWLFKQQSGGTPYGYYSPIQSWHITAVTHGLPTDHKVWRDMDRRFLDVADSLYVLKLDGWAVSKGVMDEIGYARLKCKPILYWEKGGDGYAVSSDSLGRDEWNCVP
jgi:hypothetical protein